MSKSVKDEIDQLKLIIEQQKSEIFQLNEIIQNLPGSIYWKNNQGVYLGINNTSSESMKKFNYLYQRAVILGKTDYELFDKEIADEFRKHDFKVMKSNKESSHEEVATLPSGEMVVQLSTKKPLHNEQGEVVGIIGNTVDITHLKKIQAELEEAKEEAEKANALKMEFIRNMEHDIRTPFSGIWGLANVLLLKEKDPVKISYLSDITASAKELLDYCNTILDFSKIEMGTLPILTKKICLKSIVNSVNTIEAPAARYKKLKFSLKYDKNLPAIVIGDDYRLLRILINLVSNAIKFTDTGRVSLSVKLGKKDTRKNTVIVKFFVEDTGIGISKDMQDFVFEKFNKVIPSNKNFYKGLGLGLPVVKRFVSDMEGEIDVKSEINKSTLFTCTIPFKLPLIQSDNGD